MENFKKEILLAFLIAMAANTSYSNSIKKDSKDNNELIILGTYQKLENTYTKNDIQKRYLCTRALMYKYIFIYII